MSASTASTLFFDSMDRDASSTSLASQQTIPLNTLRNEIVEDGGGKPQDPENAPSWNPDFTNNQTNGYDNHQHQNSKRSWLALFKRGGMLEPFRLLKSDLRGRPRLYHTDWFFNQLILASAVYMFFTNLLPGITFASDLHSLTGGTYGTIEVVFSTGLCGVIFALYDSFDGSCDDNR